MTDNRDLWPAWLASLAAHGSSHSVTFEISTPLEDFDAATLDCLPGYAPGWVEFVREEVQPGARIVYHLRDDSFGPLGELTLRRLSSQACELQLNFPLFANRETVITYRARAGDKLAQKLQQAYEDYRSGEADMVRLPKGMSWVEHSRLTRKWSNEFRTARKERRREVVQVYARKLIDDGIWRHAKSHRASHQRELLGREEAATDASNDPSDVSTERKAKTGPRNYSRHEKISARQEWEKRNRDLNPETLEVYLERKFGLHPGGSLKVPPSTFYGWPRESSKS